MSDDAIQRAIENGRLNAEGFRLVKNWCAHVRIERFGGVGLVEQATGLPIGPHGLACEHAPPGGIMSGDIRDAAIDFYDRNCRACTMHQPVATPNLSTWVAERDAEVERQQKAQNAETERAAHALAQRQARRQALRTDLPPVAADVVDQFEELDRQRTDELVKRLVETARLAPEAFPPPVVEYAFQLLELRERWFDEAGLQILAVIGADARRLACCAMRCLADHSAIRIAASVLLPRLKDADEELIPSVLPTAIRMASPSRDPFFGSRVPKIATLVRLHVAYPAKVAASLHTLLDGEPRQVSLAACAIRVLAHRDHAFGLPFARALISKLVRAKWLPDPEEYGHDNFRDIALDLEEAIVEVFLTYPDEIDGLLQKFMLGSSEAGELRIFAVYGRVLHTGRRFQAARPISLADRLALRRLVWEAPKTKNERVLRQIESAIHRDPYDLVDLAKDEIDALLGAAILMGERIAEFDAIPNKDDSSFLDLLDRKNRKSNLVNLRDRFVHWAAEGAAAGEKFTAYLDVLKNLPENKESLAGSMVKHAVAMMDTAGGLNAVLPFIYSALVGVSVIGRGAAADGVAEIPWRQRENLPELLWEAFLTTLSDTFVLVHVSALHALDRVRPPSKFDERARLAVLNLLHYYAKRKDDEAIALVCIDLLARRYLTAAEKAGRSGAYLVALLKKMPEWRLSSKIGPLSRELAYASGVVDLLVSLLKAPDTSEHAEGEIIEALSNLPDDVVFANRKALAELEVSTDLRSRFNLIHIIEFLGRARGFAEAEQLATAVVAAIPDNARNRPQRLSFQLAAAAAGFENALAGGDSNNANLRMRQWRDLRAAQESNDRERAQRPDPFRHLRRAP